MEKYAVDLEKVLDDFEYREKQSHQYSADQRALSDSFDCNYNVNDNIFPRHFRTPASNYRRPPFEPMNLADADFSITAKPPPPPVAATAAAAAAVVVSEKDDNVLYDGASTTAVKNSYEPKPDLRPTNIDYSFTYNLNDRNDFKPDLIESNVDFSSGLHEFDRVERNLPDVASAVAVSTTSNADVELINDRNSKIAESDKVRSENETNESIVFPQTQNNAKVVSFQMSDDVTDHVLSQYLEELVESENFDSQHDQNAVSSDPSFQTDDVPEESTEFTEDCSCSTSELEDKFGNEIECSGNENVDGRKSSSSSENDNQDYRILSDNALLISSSVDSQENLESDFTESKLADESDESDDISTCERHVRADDECSLNARPNLLYVDNEMISSLDDNGQLSSSDRYENGNIISDSNSEIRQEEKEKKEAVNENESYNKVVDANDSFTVEMNNLKIQVQDSHDQSSSRSNRPCETETSDVYASHVKSIKNQEFDANQIKPVETWTDDPYKIFVQETLDIRDAMAQQPAYTRSDESTLSEHSFSEANVEAIMVRENQPAKRAHSLIESSPSVFEHSENCHIETLDSKLAILDLASKNGVTSEKTTIISSPAACMSAEGQQFSENAALPATSGENTDDMSSDEAVGNLQAKPQRPDSLNLTHTTQTVDVSSTSADSGSLLSVEERKLGKEAPYWMPDSDTTVCMHCQLKFNPVIRRRHHCRACGLVVCAKCSDKKASLEYLGFKEDRVCHTCHSILQKICTAEPDVTSILKRPNPNNPMEYCSTIPPLLQVGSTHHPTPSVLVPKVGVLKREGRAKTNDSPKQVIFSDGIRPGGDLTELDISFEPKLPLRRSTRVTKRVGTPPGNVNAHRRLLNPDTRSFIPSGPELPPLVTKAQGECTFSESEKPLTVASEPVKFAINRNLFVIVKRLLLDCCVHKDVWCVTTEGLSCVGQDEIVFVLEVLPEENHPPKDLFSTVNTLYQEASKGCTVTEMCFAAPCTNQLFGSKEHGGFVFIRATYQCVQQLLLPKPPFLVALLIHRWETPWARLFPIRLVLRLGAEYRYYPCPLVSVRNRAALFSEIGHTIFTLLADFRKYTYTLPTVRGLMIHMEDRLTTILLPKNRYDQVIRALNKSEENVLAFAGNVSTVADSHLVCIQSIQQEDTTYHTQAINILNKPRQVTGASFIVFNGSLKQPGWSGKSNIVEDGLMVQIPSESMSALRTALRQMKDYSIGCGPQAEEMVMLKWTSDDVNFNIGVKSEIDNKALDGVPSIRVHNGIDYSGTLRLIRWTEVFILQSDDESNTRTGDSINISKLSESVAKATCVALLPLLDLLATANLTTLAVRATMHPENVGYEAGSRGEKLPPIYMKSLDEELIAVIHDAGISLRDVLNPIVLELIFKVMEQG